MHLAARGLRTTLTSMRTLISIATCVAAACTSAGGVATTQTTKEALGALLFADPSLSEPAGESCATCHDPTRAFTEPDSDRSTSGGAVAGRFGPRNTPSAMYAGAVPPRRFDAATSRWVGGLFWDGRADTLEAQAVGPLFNPLEMNLPSKAVLAQRVAAAPYAAQFDDVFGAGALEDPDTAAADVAAALAAYERCEALAPFTSKYDRWLAGDATLTPAEARGLAVFQDAARGDCASCHPPPLFTDYSYANLGIPRYANSMYLVQNPGYVDHGLMAIVGDADQDGKFRVPSLRNVMRTGPYGHNGYFENVPYLIDFLSTRDVGSARNGAWAAPEVPGTIDKRVGDLGLSDADESDLLAFLGTLSDESP